MAQFSVCLSSKETWQLRPHIRLSPVVRAGFEINACGSQRCMPKLVLEIANWHATIETPNGKAVPEQVRMYAVSLFACLICAFDLLETRSGGDAIENVLDLASGDVTSVITSEQPALCVSR